MKYSFFLFIFIFSLLGCSSLQQRAEGIDMPDTDRFEKSIPSQEVREEIIVRDQSVPSESTAQESLELKNINDDQLVGYVHNKGVVFAKVEVHGVIKSDFVNFLIEKIDDSSEKFQIYIGNKLGEKVFPWEGPDNNIGRFFIELPVGKYKISTLSIPVGSTLATEEINISFEVVPGAIVYLGTLKLVGTKEKVKLGGVPVIKPGFEYTQEVINEREDAMEDFYTRYPNFDSKIIEKLMEILN